MGKLKNETHEEYLERSRIANRAAYQKNKEKFKQRNKDNYDANKDSINANRKKLRQTDPDAVREYNRKYRAKNRQQVLSTQRNWYSKNKDKAKKIQRKARLKHRYGITIEQYDNLYVAQNRCCAICQQFAEPNTLYVDHDHVTGEIRGLLCNTCNGGLGLLQDSAKLLRRAFVYITKKRNLDGHTCLCDSLE